MNAAATTTTTKAIKKTSKAVKAPSAPMTLADLAGRYLKHLEQVGKSRGTVFSYGMEMDLAQAELGHETPIASITETMVKRFFESDRVCKTKGGKPKARPTVLKSQRVLRLSLTWAQEKGWLEKAPLPVGEKASAPVPEQA